MAIETLVNVLNFCNVQSDHFTVNAGNNQIYWKYNAGSSTLTTLTNDTYTGTTLASHLKSKIDTAFTISSTVTWNSTTRKFTIAVSAGNTIQIITSGSSGALLIGFTSDPTAAVSITSDQVALADPTADLSSIHTEVEKYIQNVYCHRQFESATYSERYDGLSYHLKKGNFIEEPFDGYILNVKQYPITAITRLSIGTDDAMRIKNTNTTTTATVAVTSTGLTLIKDGSSNTSIVFATYTTINDVITAVNALGSGWVAALQSSDFGSYQSSELMEKFGASAIKSNDVYLKVPYEAESDYEVYADRGQIFIRSFNIYGRLSVRVDYTAGYSSANMPADLKLAVKILCKHIYQKQQEETYGLDSYRIGNVSATFEKNGLPIEAEKILYNYKRILI